MATSSGGKTSDEIVNELAENITSKIPDKLDIDTALPELFEVILSIALIASIARVGRDKELQITKEAEE